MDCLTNIEHVERKLKCYALHGFKTENIFAETEFSLQSHFLAPMYSAHLGNKEYTVLENYLSIFPILMTISAWLLCQNPASQSSSNLWANRRSKKIANNKKKHLASNFLLSNGNYGTVFLHRHALHKRVTALNDTLCS